MPLEKIQDQLRRKLAELKQQLCVVHPRASAQPHLSERPQPTQTTKPTACPRTQFHACTSRARARPPAPLCAILSRRYELINQDYPQFMTLANGLAGVDERSAALRAPLVHLGRTVDALLRGAQRSRAQLEAVATARLSLERRRRGVERCLRFSETDRKSVV